MTFCFSTVAGTVPSKVWPVDDRFRSLPAEGIAAVARGRGPTYGGHYAPVNLDSGLQITLDELLLAPVRTESAVRNAVATAEGRLPVFEAGGRPLRHSGWTITVVALAEETAILAHVGVCRAYLWRRSELIQMTMDDSVAVNLINEGRPDHAANFSETESRLLGIGTPFQIQTAKVGINASDTFILLTPGVWTSFTHDQLAAAVRRDIGQPATLLFTLLQQSERNSGLGATAMIASVREGSTAG
jgi:PPM family protein phosphatase